MTEEIAKRRRKPVSVEAAPEAKPEPVMRKRKNIIGSSMPYVAPEAQKWTGTALGYRPKAKKSRPILQPNPV